MPSWFSVAARFWWSLAGGQVQCLLVAARGGVEVIEQDRLWLSGGAGVVEPVQGDAAERAEALGAAEVLGGVEQGEAVLVPVLGLVQVTQPGHETAGVAEAEGEHSFGRRSPIRW